LRVIGDPLETLAEDPLRILRIGRFISKLGFEPTPELRRAADERADGILDISEERWLQEMSKLLRGPHVAGALLFLHRIRILGMILPEVDALFDFRPGVPACSDGKAADAEPGEFWVETVRSIEAAPRVEPSADARLCWALLLQHIGKRWTAVVGEDGEAAGKNREVRFPGHKKVAAHAAAEIAKRFRFDNKTAREVRFLLLDNGEEREYEPAWSDARIRRYARRVDRHVEAMLNFARASSRRDEDLSRIDQLAARIDELAAQNTLRPELPSGLGNHLMKALGLKPSPLIGELKDWLEDEIIEERIESRQDADYYIDYVRRMNPDFLAESKE
jgi:tRNA nucleotidyltransferase/poly(A) polymerase